MTRVLRLARASDEAIAAIYRGLRAQAEGELRHLKAASDIRWSRYAYMRYAGQGFEIQVDLPAEEIGAGYAEQAIAAFHASYARKHRWSEPAAAVEGVDWVLVATVPAGAHKGLRLDGALDSGAVSRTSTRPAWFPEAGGFTDTRIVDRQALAARGTLEGPAIIEDPDCTAVVLPGDTVGISPSGNLRIDVSLGSGRA